MSYKDRNNQAKRVRCLLAGTLLALSAVSAVAQITPSADSYTSTAQGSTNFGTKSLLDVQSATQTSYIQFDLSSIPSGYTGSNVAKASLKLYVNAVTTAGSLNVDFVNGSWAEKTITADLAPALGATIVASVPLAQSNAKDYILIDVTPAVVAWLNGTQANDGIALVGNSPINVNFDSKESTTTSHPPELDVVFAGSGGSGITGVLTGSKSGLTGGGTSGTLNLSLLTSCSKNQVLAWSGSAWACSSAGTGTLTGVTAGTDLTGGGTSGTVTLNLDTTKIPQLASSNAFTGIQSISGNSSNSILNVTQNATSGPGFGVVGTSYNNNRGQAAVLGQEMATSSAGVFGVEGFIGSLKGAGVYGQDSNPQSSVGNATAVSAGVWGDSGGGTEGVLGTSTNFNSVVGLNSSSASAAIFAENQNTSSSVLAPGIFGISFAPKGIAVVGSGPVHSNTFTSYAGQYAYGVVGDAGPAANVGVFGSADSGTGVFGASTSSGTGVYGFSNTGSGVIGTSNGGNAGVYGLTNNTNTNEGSVGVWGDDPTTTGNAGVFGYSQGGTGVVGQSASSDEFGGYFINQGGGAPFIAIGTDGNCEVNTDGDQLCTGSKSAAVHLSDSRWVRLYAVESPENWFEDFGSGTLSNGSASVALEPAFRDTVTSSQDYHVFLTPRGECEGLYIASTNASGFEVRELHHGKSSIAFDYRIVVRRKGYENIRMQDVTEMEEHIIAHRQEMMKRLPRRPPVVQPTAQPMANRAQAEIQLPVPLRPNPPSHSNRLPIELLVQPAPATTKR